MKKTSILLCLLAAMLIPAIAQAKPEGEGKKFDTDGDGALSLEEATNAGRDRLVENFGEIDADGDGVVTREEMKTFGDLARENRKAKRGEFDTDQNGKLSIDEASAAGMDKLVENFEKVDLDGDGEISRREMQTLRKRMHQKKQRGKGSLSDEA